MFLGHQQVLQRSDIEHDYDNSKLAFGAIKSHKAQLHEEVFSHTETFYSLLCKFLYILHCQRAEKLRINSK